MLSEEEKKAIEHLTKKMKYHKDNPLDTYVWLTLDEHYVRINLNLIEKQSKEIEDYIENKELINQTLGLEKDSDINKTLEKIIILNNYEDKIKAKIEDILNSENGEAIEKLIEWHSLLEKE